MKRKKAIVIGAGFGGLSVSAYLAKAGWDVLVLEKNESAGGRARVFKEKGFVFDMGPSWYMMLDYFESFFNYFGFKSKDFYETVLLSPSYRIKYESGEIFDISSNIDENVKLFNSVEAGAGDRLLQYLQDAKTKYELANKFVLNKSVNKFFDFFSLGLIANGLKLNIFTNFDRHVRNYFKDEKLVKIMEYITLFLGSAPNQLLSVYSLMNYVDFYGKVWYPMGGLGKVVDAFKKVCEFCGVKFVFNSPVRAIEVKNSTARGVWVNNEFFEADVIISNADYAFTEISLLEKTWQTYPKSYWEKKKLAPSAFIMYIGVNRKLESLAHHNYFFRNDWSSHFKSVFENPAWEENPNFYLCVPSKTDSSVAPQGCENLFLLIPVASNLKDDEVTRLDYRQKALNLLNDFIGCDISKNIIFERVYALNDFAYDYNAYKGTALGISLNFGQTGYFRPHTKSKKVKNLYYVGQYTHPGCGMAPCIISGKNVASDVLRDFGNA